MATDAELPDRCFAYVPSGEPPSARKLKLCANETGKLDKGIVGAAAAALSSGGFRGQKASIPSSALASVKRKVRGAWRSVNPGKNDQEMPASIRS